MPFLEVSDGTKLNYVDWGSGKPIVFLHGRGGSLELFGYQTAQLSKEFRVLAFDARGHGSSDKPNSSYSHDEFARDVRDFITTLGLDKVDLVGASTGSFVIQNYVKKYGSDGISTIALISSTPVFAARDDFPYAFSPKGFDEIKAKLNTDYPRSVMEFNRFLFHGEPSAATLNWMFGISLKTPLLVLLKTLDANIAMDYRDVLASFNKPTLLIQGVHDKLCPFGAAKFMSEHIRGSRLELFENSGHCPYIEEQQKMNEILEDFVRNRQFQSSNLF